MKSRQGWFSSVLLAFLAAMLFLGGIAINLLSSELELSFRESLGPNYRLFLTAICLFLALITGLLARRQINEARLALVKPQTVQFFSKKRKNRSKQQTRKTDKIEIHRVLSLLGEDNDLIGYEILVTNGLGANAWIESVKFLFKVSQYCPCSGNLDVVAKYRVNLIGYGEIRQASNENTILETASVKGIVEDDTAAKYLIHGKMDYHDNCAFQTG